MLNNIEEDLLRGCTQLKVRKMLLITRNNLLIYNIYVKIYSVNKYIYLITLLFFINANENIVLLNELKIAGFKIKKIFQATETDKQTGLYLSQS